MRTIIEYIRQFLIKTEFVRCMQELDVLKTKASLCAYTYRYLNHPLRQYDPVVDSYKIQHNDLVDKFNSKKYWWISHLERIQ